LAHATPVVPSLRSGIEATHAPSKHTPSEHGVRSATEWVIPVPSQVPNVHSVVGTSDSSNCFVNAPLTHAGRLQSPRTSSASRELSLSGSHSWFWQIQRKHGSPVAPQSPATLHRRPSDSGGALQFTLVHAPNTKGASARIQRVFTRSIWHRTGLSRN